VPPTGAPARPHPNGGIAIGGRHLCAGSGSRRTPDTGSYDHEKRGEGGDKVRDGKFEFVITKITHRKTAGQSA
jgi:hypothetical protein